MTSPRKGGRRTPSRVRHNRLPRWRALCTACMPTIRRRLSAGTMLGLMARRPRSLSWSATTPTSRSWSTTMSRGTRRRIRMDQRPSFLVLSVSSRTNTPAGWAYRPVTSSWTPNSSTEGDALSPEFKRAASAEIEQFKREYRERFPGADVESLTDEDVLREVMNTVGKPGDSEATSAVSSQFRCCTEGWDATTVTHILGVRAFGTQLLCEQVVGRGLRRRSFALDDDGRFSPEYAEVYGVPFSFIPASGATKEPPPRQPITHVRSLPERAAAGSRFRDSMAIAGRSRIKTFMLTGRTSRRCFSPPAMSPRQRRWQGSSERLKSTRLTT